MKLEFGNPEHIKYKQDYEFKNWIVQNWEFIDEQINFEHGGECPECGQDIECDGDMSDMKFTVIEHNKGHLQFCAECKKCHSEQDITLQNYDKATDVDDVKILKGLVDIEKNESTQEKSL